MCVVSWWLVILTVCLFLPSYRHLLVVLMKPASSLLCMLVCADVMLICISYYIRWQAIYMSLHSYPSYSSHFYSLSSQSFPSSSFPSYFFSVVSLPSFSLFCFSLSFTFLFPCLSLSSNHSATTAIYTPSLHAAIPISCLLTLLTTKLSPIPSSAWIPPLGVPP